MSSFKICRLSN